MPVPQCWPLSNEKSKPQWLNPAALSFWPATRLRGLTGLALISSSAWRRNVQSWLTRTLLAGLRLAQPAVSIVTPDLAPPGSAVLSARTLGSSRSDGMGAAAATAPPEMVGTSFLVPSGRTSAGRRTLPWATLTIVLCADAVVGAAQTMPSSTVTRPRTTR